MLHPLRAAVGIAALSLFGCHAGELTPSSLPRDVHAQPDQTELTANPCRYGDLSRCISKCRAEDPQSCNAAGMLFEFHAHSSDPTRASELYKRACDEAYAPGCTNLAWLHLAGRGVPRDHARAMRLFVFAYDKSKMACISGDLSACLLAGDLVYEGRGVEQDDAQALSLFDRACEGGEQKGCARAALVRR